MNILRKVLMVRVSKVKGRRDQQQEKMKKMIMAKEAIHTVVTNTIQMQKSGHRLSLCGDIDTPIYEINQTCQ